MRVRKQDVVLVQHGGVHCILQSFHTSVNVLQFVKPEKSKPECPKLVRLGVGVVVHHKWHSSSDLHPDACKLPWCANISGVHYNHARGFESRSRDRNKTLGCKHRANFLSKIPLTLGDVWKRQSCFDTCVEVCDGISWH